MPSLFENTQLRSLTLPNRFVRSATHEGMADNEGKVTQELTEYLTLLAEGEVGLIISGHAAVTPQGRASPRQLMAHDDACIPGLTKLTSAVHAAGGKIALQIAHAGIFANPWSPDISPAGPSEPAPETGRQAKAFSEKELDSLVDAFAAAAARGVKAGFDAVQIHAAHTYLLSQFLSPFFNKRDDAYGGTLENRARLLLRVVDAVRGAVGANCPVLVKFNSEDYLEHGLSSDDAVSLAAMLEQAGVDAIELSGGSFLPFAGHSPSRKGLIKKEDDELYYRETAAKIKKSCRLPLILVGGVHSLHGAELALESGFADYLALSRPLICEPDLIKKWRTGQSVASECLSDNLCFTPIMKGESLYCVTWAKKRAKAGQGEQ